VVLSIHDFQKLKNKRGSLVDFFQSSPLKDIPLERAKDIPRNEADIAQTGSRVLNPWNL
jgi:hypothetical protein